MLASNRQDVRHYGIYNAFELLLNQDGYQRATLALLVLRFGIDHSLFFHIPRVSYTKIDSMDSNPIWQAQKAEHEAVFDSEGTPDSHTKIKKNERKVEELKETPIFSGSVLAEALRFDPPRDSRFANNTLQQYGLLAKIIDSSPISNSLRPGELPMDAQDNNTARGSSDPRLFANIDTPWSTFICGSQGSGKSNTLSCLLEAGLLKNNRLGLLDHPLTSLVFHYDQFSSTESHSICEAAYLASHKDLSLDVYVSPNNYQNMKRAYEEKFRLLGVAKAPNVKPLFLRDTQLSVRRMRTLMSVDENGKNILYLQVGAFDCNVLKALTDFAMPGHRTHIAGHVDGRSNNGRRELQEVSWSSITGEIQRRPKRRDRASIESA